MKSTSTYQVHFTESQQYLTAVISGTRTRESVSSASIDILNTCVSKKYRLLLVDIREFSGDLAPYDSMFIITKLFRQLPNVRFLNRLSIIDRPENQKEDWLFETIAFNRGYSIRIFNDPHEAAAWLTSE